MSEFSSKVAWYSSASSNSFRFKEAVMKNSANARVPSTSEKKVS